MHVISANVFPLRRFHLSKSFGPKSARVESPQKFQRKSVENWLMFHAAVRDLPAARQNWKMVIDSFPKAVGLELKTFRMSLLYFTASFDNINVN